MNRAGELWTAGSCFVALVLDTHVSEGAYYGETAGQVMHRCLDLAAADVSSQFNVEERVLSDPLSGWRRLA